MCKKTNIIRKSGFYPDLRCSKQVQRTPVESLERTKILQNTILVVFCLNKKRKK